MFRSLLSIALALAFGLFLVVVVGANSSRIFDGWELVAPLPQPLAYHRAVMQGNMIYVVGGEVPPWMTPVAPVLQAEVTPINGGVSDWITPMPASRMGDVPLPVPLHRHALVKVVWGSEPIASLYVIGGWSNGNRYSDVWRADLVSSTAPPSLTGWQRSASYPRKIIMHEAIYAQNHIYILGGLDENDKALDEIYYAPINSNTGGLGAWTKTYQALPNLRYRFAAVYVNVNCTPRIYILGGYDGTDAKDQVYSIKIDLSDGNLKEEWIKQRTLPNAIYNHQVIFDGQSLIVIGGGDDKQSIDKIYSATVELDGKLGVWNEEELLPESLYRFAVAFDPGATMPQRNIYILGGKHYDNFQAQVYRSFKAPPISVAAVGADPIYLPLIIGRQACP